MKKLITLMLILGAGQTFGQQNTTAKLIVDSRGTYNVAKLGQTYQSMYATETVLADGTVERSAVIDTITADLIVNYDPRHKDNEQIHINSSRAKLNNDTLVIDLFHHGPGFFWEYKILITNGQYQIATWFTPPINSKLVKIKPSATILKLNTANFVKGQLIKGYTQYRGKCLGNEMDCFFSKEIFIEGDFIVRVE